MNEKRVCAKGQTYALPASVFASSRNVVANSSRMTARRNSYGQIVSVPMWDFAERDWSDVWSFSDHVSAHGD